MMLLHHGQCNLVDWKDREPAAGLEEANGHDPPMGDGHMAVSCFLDVKGTSCQPTASENGGSQSYVCREVDSANKLNKLGIGVSLDEPPDKDTAWLTP